MHTLALQGYQKCQRFEISALNSDGTSVDTWYWLHKPNFDQGSNREIFLNIHFLIEMFILKDWPNNEGFISIGMFYLKKLKIEMTWRKRAVAVRVKCFFY
jgi:hypothetical protein